MLIQTTQTVVAFGDSLGILSHSIHVYQIDICNQENRCPRIATNTTYMEPFFNGQYIVSVIFDTEVVQHVWSSEPTVAMCLNYKTATSVHVSAKAVLVDIRNNIYQI